MGRDKDVRLEGDEEVMAVYGRMFHLKRSRENRINCP